MIWRRLLVSEEMTLFGLHRTIQIAFGWKDYHLHAFKLHGRHYGTTRTGERHRDRVGKEVTLTDLQQRVRQRIRYEYDFSDLWKHEIRVFLIGFKRGEPDWSLLNVDGAEALPAVRWKQMNLDKLPQEAREKLVAQLTAVLNRG